MCAQVASLRDALRQLLILDALDRDGHITDMGRRMAALPLEPSLARSLLAAADAGCLPDALTVVAMLSAETIFAGNRRDASPAGSMRGCITLSIHETFPDFPCPVLDTRTTALLGSAAVQMHAAVVLLSTFMRLRAGAPRSWCAARRTPGGRRAAGLVQRAAAGA
jgi:HrpA-like RNA helicase